MGVALIVNEEKIGTLHMLDTQCRDEVSLDEQLNLLDLGNILSNVILEHWQAMVNEKNESINHVIIYDSANNELGKQSYNNTNNQKLLNVEIKAKCVAMQITKETIENVFAIITSKYSLFADNYNANSTQVTCSKNDYAALQNSYVPPPSTTNPNPQLSSLLSKTNVCKSNDSLNDDHPKNIVDKDYEANELRSASLLLETNSNHKIDKNIQEEVSANLVKFPSSQIYQLKQSLQMMVNNKVLPS
jgi:hypothetical protein